MSNPKSPEERAREITLEEAEELAMQTDYAVFANEETGAINKADAGAFYLEGYKACYHSRDTEVAELRETLKGFVDSQFKSDMSYDNAIIKAKQLLDDGKETPI